MARGNRYGSALLLLAAIGLANKPLVAQTAVREPDLSTLTAEELLNRGLNAYNAADFASARAALARFATEYGDSAEGGPALERVLPLLATAQLQERRFDEALASIDRLFTKFARLKPAVAEEMAFWRAVCLMQAATGTLTGPVSSPSPTPSPTPRRSRRRDRAADSAPNRTRPPTGTFDSSSLDRAREAFDRFLADYPGSPHREEAVLLSAACRSLGGRFGEAADFLGPQTDRLSPPNRGRAVVMRLHALVEAGRHDDAHTLLLAEFPRSSDNLQIVSFHALALELGSHFLDREEPRKAISCLQRVWNRERLIRHQEARFAELEQHLAAARQQTADAFRILTLEQMLAKTRRELDHFRKIESFDASVRFRLARAFIDMGRWREAALILEEMVNRLAPNPITEEAALNLVRCWMQLERWPRAAETAAAFEDRFPRSARLAEALFLGAQSLKSGGRIEESIAAFARIADDPVGSAFAARARFLQAFGHLLLDRPDEALPVLAAVGDLEPDRGLRETVLYWTGMAHSLARNPAEARKVLADYLKTYPEGRYASEAVYRRAYCAQSQRDYPTAIRELRAFLKEHADHPRANEARILLGDALLATGDLDKGIVALKGVTTAEPRLFEEAWFKIGRAFRLQEKHELLRAHMEQFVHEHPASARVPEAIYWIGWTWRKQDRPDRAAEAYWAALIAHGDDPGKHAVEDLLATLPKLHPGPEGRIALETRLRELRSSAATARQVTLEARALWSLSRLVERSDPDAASAMRREMAPLLDLTRANPLLIADAAEAFRAAGDSTEANRLFRELLRWNPNAAQRDRAFAGLGLIAAEEGRPEEALAWFDRFERESSGSALEGSVTLRRAGILRDIGRAEEAVRCLEALLASRTVPRADKARGLFELGELRMAQGKPSAAVPYYQRLYVMYGRWPELVARAYLRSGEAFEQLDDPESARKTYEELLHREDLAAFEQSIRAARERLARLAPAGSKEEG